MSGEVFDGRTDGRTADKKRRINFILGSPSKLVILNLAFKILLIRIKGVGHWIPIFKKKNFDPLLSHV